MCNIEQVNSFSIFLIRDSDRIILNVVVSSWIGSNILSFRSKCIKFSIPTLFVSNEIEAVQCFSRFIDELRCGLLKYVGLILTLWFFPISGVCYWKGFSYVLRIVYVYALRIFFGNLIWIWLIFLFFHFIFCFLKAWSHWRFLGILWFDLNWIRKCFFIVIFDQIMSTLLLLMYFLFFYF